MLGLLDMFRGTPPFPCIQSKGGVPVPAPCLLNSGAYSGGVPVPAPCLLIRGVLRGKVSLPAPAY